MVVIVILEGVGLMSVAGSGGVMAVAAAVLTTLCNPLYVLDSA